jgi:hypothetical protein
VKCSTKLQALCTSAFLLIATGACELGPDPNDPDFENQLGESAYDDESEPEGSTYSSTLAGLSAVLKDNREVRGAGGTYGGPGDTVPSPGPEGKGFNLGCEDNPLLTFYSSVCDVTGACMTDVYLHSYVADAIVQGSTINAQLISESQMMRSFAQSYGWDGYPKDTCDQLWPSPSWMFMGKGAMPFMCMAINWPSPGTSYADLHADVCSTTALFYGSP